MKKHGGIGGAGLLVSLVMLAMSLPLAARAASLDRAAGSPSPSPTATSSSPAGPAGSTGPTTTRNDTFGLGPASVAKIDGRPYFSYESSPDGRLTDHVAVVNFDYRPLTLQIFVADASNAADGSIVFGNQGQATHDVGSWISLETPRGSSTLVVPARGTVIVPFVLTIPENAQPGDHAGAIVLADQSELVGNTSKAKFEQRIASRVFVRLTGALRPKVTVSHVRVSFADDHEGATRGTALVSWTVTNAGNVDLGGRQSVTVSGLFGRTGRVSAVPSVPVLLPGGVVAYSAAVHAIVPEGYMKVRVSLTPETVSTSVDPSVARSSASVHFWALPWALIVIVLLVVLAVILGIRYRRHRDQPRTGIEAPRGELTRR